MNTAARFIATSAVLVVAAFALVQWCALPWMCEARKRGVESRWMTIPRRDVIDAHVVARSVAVDAENCLKVTPNDLDWQLMAAASYRMTGQPQRAITTYLHALQRYRRPEVFWSLGQAYYENGDRERALVYMSRAALFSPSLLDEMDAQGDLRDPLQRLVRDRETMIRLGRGRR